MEAEIRGRMFFQFFLIFVLMFPRSLFGNIDRYYDYYETLHHNSFKHHIVRRDLYSENPAQRLLEFDSHGRHFKLVLHKSTSLVAEDFAVTFVNENGSHAMKFDPGIYQGYVEDEPTTSSVTAYWDDRANELTATISTDSDVFTIEPSWHFLPVSDDYNLISYKASDSKQNKISPGTCGTPVNNVKKDNDSKSSRNRRSSELSDSLPRKTCQVRLVADYKFFEKVGKLDKALTVKHLLGLMGWVDHLFRENSFDTCGKGFGFQIKNITVHDSPKRGRNGFHYNNNSSMWDSSEALLKAFTYSEELLDNSQYCLVHLFTAVGFKTNVFGIAYVANPNNGTNGICSDSGKNKSGVTNTGWTTFVDRDGKRLPARQAYLVTAHEFGHGWGSSHDPDSLSCAPRDIDGGKYIMFHSAVNGLQKNNEIFSSCSKLAICEVLKKRSQVCFTDKSTCGNFIRDNGEACDEGPAGIVRDQSCCTEKCQFRPGCKCSDWNDECCVNCHYANSTKVCHEEGDEPCTEKTLCSGSSPNCPTAITSKNGSECFTRAGTAGTCSNKTCITHCEFNHLNSCLCDAVNTSCQVCCRNDTDGGNCTEFRNASATINVPNNTPCPMGICVNGTCQRITDVTVVRPWNFINFESAGAFVIFMKNNIVGSVIVISLVLWIPASCGVSYIDRKRARELREEDAHFDILSQLIASSVNSLTKIKVTTGTIERKGLSRSREAL